MSVSGTLNVLGKLGGSHERDVGTAVINFMAFTLKQESERRDKSMRVKVTHLSQKSIGIKPRFYILSLLLFLCFIIATIREKLLFIRLFPLKYLKCCCNSKYHLRHIYPGSKEYELEYLIEMCYRR